MQPALLFDLDGTLVSTDHLHFRAFVDLLARFGRSFSEEEFGLRVLGRPNELIFADYFPDCDAAERRRMADAKEAHVRAMIADIGRLEPTSGLIALLDWADRSRVPTAIVTNAPPANADVMLRAIGLEKRLTIIVSGEVLPHGKPHPLPYLEGLRLTDGDAARSVAFEDSAAGLTSAVAAKIASVGIAVTADAAAALTRSGAALIARDFTDPALLALVQERLAVS